MSDDGVMVYVGRDKCGCYVSVHVDEPENAKGVAKWVASDIKDGLAVERMAIADFRKLPFGHKCGRVPR
jgi:hypothetical protein